MTMPRAPSTEAFSVLTKGRPGPRPVSGETPEILVLSGFRFAVAERTKIVRNLGVRRGTSIASAYLANVFWIVRHRVWIASITSSSTAWGPAGIAATSSAVAVSSA